jgi:hypothetical protein
MLLEKQWISRIVGNNFVRRHLLLMLLHLHPALQKVDSLSFNLFSKRVLRIPGRTPAVPTSLATRAAKRGHHCHKPEQ